MLSSSSSCLPFCPCQRRQTGLREKSNDPLLFNAPMRVKNGTQMHTKTIPNGQNGVIDGMLVMPKMEVTNCQSTVSVVQGNACPMVYKHTVSGRKKIESSVSILML